jgi:ABC-type dipeptide/oligopeptide/nickel transport system permease subunit
MADTVSESGGQAEGERPSLAAEFEAVKQRSLWMDALERMVRNKAAVIGGIIATTVILMAVVGPYVAPYDYLRNDFSRIAEAPSLDHWMGTDVLGRDFTSRIFNGARTAVFVAAVVLIISTTVGVTLGATAGFVGRWVDDVIIRIGELLSAFPNILMAAFLSVTMREPVTLFLADLYAKTAWDILNQRIYIDYFLMFGAISATEWVGYARLVRGQVLTLKEMGFIRAERALGVPQRMIITKHLVPNAISPIIVSVSAGVGGVMLTESTLSFLGLGIQPPAASWGNMVSENLTRWRYDPHLVVMPGMVLAIAVFGFNFLGDGLNDALNPRAIQR